MISFAASSQRLRCAVQAREMSMFKCAYSQFACPATWPAERVVICAAVSIKNVLRVSYLQCTWLQQMLIALMKIRTDQNSAICDDLIIWMGRKFYDESTTA